MKKIVISLFLSGTLVLSGCFGGDKEDTATTVPGGFKTNEFQINSPETWEIFTKKDFTSDIPANTEIILRSKQKDEIFIANINVTRNELAENMSAEDYAKKLLQSNGILFLNFKKLDEKKSDNGYVIFFEGKENAGDPLLRFIQHIVSKDKKIFIATAAFNPADDEQVRKEAQEITESLKAL